MSAEKETLYFENIDSPGVSEVAKTRSKGVNCSMNLKGTIPPSQRRGSGGIEIGAGPNLLPYGFPFRPLPFFVAWLEEFL